MSAVAQPTDLLQAASNRVLTLTPTPATLPHATASPMARVTGTAIVMPTLTVQPTERAANRSANVPILMYHYISIPPRNADRYRLDLSVLPANFDAQLAYLQSNGYSTISLDDLYNYLAGGASLPPRPIILTFDDGYRDAYDIALPLLQKHRMTGTFFIISDFISSGNPAYLTWDMVKEMSNAGMSIESHTRSHPDLRNRSHDYLIWQILGPIEAITVYTGKRPLFFCYPSGRYDAAVIQVLRSVGTLAAVTTQNGTTHTLADAMTWSRLRVHGSTTLQQFVQLVS